MGIAAIEQVERPAGRPPAPPAGAAGPERRSGGRTTERGDGAGELWWYRQLAGGSAFSARVAPTAKKPTGSIATTRRLRDVNGDVGSRASGPAAQRSRRRGVGCGRRSARIRCRGLSPASVPNDAPTAKAPSSSGGRADGDVEEDRGGELVPAQQGHGHRIAEVGAVDRHHGADDGAGLLAWQLEDAAGDEPGKEGGERDREGTRPSAIPMPWSRSTSVEARLKKTTGGAARRGSG